MENIDLNQTLAPGVSIMITAGGMLLLSALIVMTIVIFKRWKGRFVPMILGVLTYIIFVFIFTNMIFSALILIPTFDAAFDNNPTVYTILYYIVSAIGITIARVLLGNMMVGRYERQGDVMLGGIGISLGDAFLYGATALTMSVSATGVTNLGLQAMFADMSSSEIISAYEGMESLFTAPAFVWLLYGVSAVMDVALCLALMTVVYGAVSNQIPRIWILFSAIIQFAVSVVFQLMDYTSPLNILVTFSVKAILLIASMQYIYKVVVKDMKYQED